MAKRKSTVAVVALVCGVLCAMCLVGAVLNSEGRSEWIAKACYSNDCIASTLNAMPTERAAEAKLTTWGSGVGAITYVWYRK